jgi:hypothetical protein
MITAKEAKRIVLESDANVNLHCELIGKEIEKAAQDGKLKIVLDFALPHRPEFRVEKRDFHDPEFTSFQRRIKDELEKNGFMVKIITVDHDGRGGLGNCDDDPQPYKTYHIQVSW